MIKNLSVRTVPQNTHTGTPAERSGGILWLLTGISAQRSRTHLLGSLATSARPNLHAAVPIGRHQTAQLQVPNGPGDAAPLRFGPSVAVDSERPRPSPARGCPCPAAP